MIESEVIINKLKSEGIDENLSKGVNFETEEALNEWVSTAKTFATKPKSIEEYTKEEIAAILKDPQPKAKGLQGYVDSLRSKEPKVDVPPVNKPELEIPDEIKEKLAKFDEFFASTDKSQKESKFNAELSKHVSGLDQYEVDLIKSKLSIESNPEDIKKEVDSFRNYMVKKGFDGYKVGGSDQKNKVDDSTLDEAVKRIVEKKNKSKK